MEEKIWEISCEGIELSAIQEDDPEENKTDATYNILELDRIEGAGYYTNISDVKNDNSLSDIIASALTWNLGIFIMERNGSNVNLSEKSFFQNCQVARIIECPILTPLPILPCLISPQIGHHLQHDYDYKY